MDGTCVAAATKELHEAALWCCEAEMNHALSLALRTDRNESKQAGNIINPQPAHRNELLEHAVWAIGCEDHGNQRSEIGNTPWWRRWRSDARSATPEPS